MAILKEPRLLSKNCFSETDIKAPVLKTTPIKLIKCGEFMLVSTESSLLFSHAFGMRRYSATKTEVSGIPI